MKKFFLYALPLAAVFGAIYWVNGWLNSHALVAFDGEKWDFVSGGGWRLFLDGWPVFAVFGLVAAAIAALLTLFFGDGAVESAKAKAEAEAEKKHAYGLKIAEERAAKAEAAKAEAEERARSAREYAEAEAEAAYEERVSALARKERALKDAKAEAEAEAEESRKFRASALRQIEKSASCAIEQEKAKQAATAYGNRLKKQTLKAIEAAYAGDSEKLSRLYAKLKAEAEREAENPHEKAENSCLENAKRFFA